MQFSAANVEAYDLPRVVSGTINEVMAVAPRRAFGRVARDEVETCVAAGRDGRPGGASLSASLMRGLVAAGEDVIDMVTTPMPCFAARTLCTIGIQVAGNHNPRDSNGFNMGMAVRTTYPEEIQTHRNFPGHPPGPSKSENLRDPVTTLKTRDAELGVAFDVDGDRLGIVTKEGTHVYPDRQMPMPILTPAIEAAGARPRPMAAVPGTVSTPAAAA